MQIKQSGICNIKAPDSVCIMMPSNLYGCELCEDVFIGPFVEVQCDVRIGARTRVQSHSFICSLVEIGEDCFIGHGVKFVNDDFKKGSLAKKTEWRGTFIGNRVLIGTNATIMPVRICDNVIIGAGSVVTKDIVESGFYAGNPAKKIRSLAKTK